MITPLFARMRLPPPLWSCLLLAAVVAGSALRLDQFATQVLIDDEWHAIHQVLRRNPGSMFFDFGFSDYSIPLGIYNWCVARWFGLSETAMRMPMMLSGLATLVLFPIFVARRLSNATAVVFALLLAISPLLILYSRMARPYAITLLLGWIAHAAFRRYQVDAPGSRRAAVLYGVTATLTAWLHPIAAPFVLAPLVWSVAQMGFMPPHQRRPSFMRLLKVALPTGVAMATLLLPPLLANPASMTLKGGVDMMDLGTLGGVWYAWLGTPSSVVVILCMAFASMGAKEVWHQLPEARTAALGVGMTLLALVAARPAWSFMPLAMARYLLPFLPLLLLAVAAGAVRLALLLIATTASPWRRAAGALIAIAPCIALASQSPLIEFMHRPSSQALHLVHHFDFRPDENPYLPSMTEIPLSSFWTELATIPPGSVRVAAAPFYFESFNWDAPRWERASGQTVLPGFLTGLCVQQRWGEVPPDPRFRFDNAVHLADGARIARRGIDYVVWQKPYLRLRNGVPITVGGDTSHCERVIRSTFGSPIYEDAYLIAFRMAPP